MKEPAFEKYPIYLLLKMGKAVCPTDYVVRYYYNPKHEKYYKNHKELLRTIRRTWSIGAFNHREQMGDIIQKWE